MDGLGASTVTETFGAVGTAADSLMGICESQYTPGLPVDATVELAERCIRLGQKRDTESGSNVRLLTLCRDGIYQRDVEVALE